ncbi:hypothetical protein [Lutibacter sp.]|uniref:hypothetical protein n=1 Tax=Lutibacter sp. TaxID=1925666 RepID=UPI0035647296
MATYKEIFQWLKEESGVSVKNCHIAHVKSMHNLITKVAPNRQGENRVYPCPENKIVHIEAAFKHFGMIKYLNQAE